MFFCSGKNDRLRRGPISALPLGRRDMQHQEYCVDLPLPASAVVANNIIVKHHQTLNLFSSLLASKVWH